MSNLKSGKFEIELDKKRHLLFTLNALDEVQDKFGSFEAMGDSLNGEDNLKNLRYLLTLLINEGADDDEILSEKEVGKLIHIGNINYVKDCLIAAFSLGTSGANEDPDNDEDTSKNATTAMLE